MLFARGTLICFLVWWGQDMSERFKPYLTVALIIEHEGRFLMVEEFQETGELCFGTIAGHVEAKESIIAAALREGREECGCEVELDHLVGIYDYVKDYETIIRFTFAAHLKDRDPSLVKVADPDHKIQAIKWYTREDIYAQKSMWRTRLIGYNFDDYFKGQKLPLSSITEVRA